MCLINYNKNRKEYKHLTYAEKTMIERWHNKDKKSNKEISELLNKSERTIRREIKSPFYRPCGRGKTGIRTPEALWALTRFPGVPLQPLEHLSSFTVQNYLFSFDLHNKYLPFFKNNGHFIFL
jgi:hypothetical protein